MIEQLRKQVAEACSNICFDKHWHTYTVEDQRLSPVTKKVHSYEEAADWDTIAYYKAKSLSKQSDIPVTKEEVLAMWAKKRDEAALKGTAVHEYIQRYPSLPHPPTLPEELGAVGWFKSLPNYYHIIAQEKMLYSLQLGVAGTADLILYNEQDSCLAIADWKSNEDLNKNFKQKTLKKPYDHLLDTPYNKYSIQQNYYRQLLEPHVDIPISEMWLIHLHPSYKECYQAYPVDYLEVF